MGHDDLEWSMHYCQQTTRSLHGPHTCCAYELKVYQPIYAETDNVTKTTDTNALPCGNGIGLPACLQL